MTKTTLKKLYIKKFRALAGVDIEFGGDIAVICGKNGTSKSSILGIAAQIFSFKKDYTKNITLEYQTITGINFKSQYSDHFRISDKFDLPGSMEVDIELFDGYTKKIATAELGLSARKGSPRPVVRKNSTVVKGNTSRNFTHPVIYLSLKRLYPIVDRDYEVCNFEYLTTHQAEFLNLTNELLNRNSSNATSTTGMIHSAVAHGGNYDQDSVSAGEDNAGQLVLALLSFKKLQKEYADYKGGLLLIDEADAGLFPAAQINLVEILQRECKKLNLQVIMTSHSPILIEYIFKKSQKFQERFKTIYLTDTYGSIQVMHGKSWPEIEADLNTKTIPASVNIEFPLINIYFEDDEAAELFKAVMYRHPAKKFLRLLGVSLGHKNYIDLVGRKIDEFSKKSIICLDGDVKQEKIARYPSIILLPGKLAPDQIVFEYLYNLPADHPVWDNSLKFNRPMLTKIARPLMSRLNINVNTIDLKTLITKDNETCAGKESLRNLFKKFYNNKEFLSFISKEKVWRLWTKNNQSECDEFVLRFVTQLKATMQNGYYVDKSKLNFLDQHR